MLFVVDCVKRLSFEVRNSLILFNRLASKGFDPQNKLILDAMQDGSFDEAAFASGAYQMTQQEKDLVGAFPSTLVLNKVDLISSKRKMRELQAELEDLNPFEEVFHVSCETGYGISELRQYLQEKATVRPWAFDPRIVSTQSPVERAEDAMK